MYHTPRRAGRIIMACAVLHNIARRTGMPDPDQNEVDPDDDAFRPAPAPRVQPDALPPVNVVQLGVHRRARDAFIRRQFRLRR